jgi:Tfp pilus assembly protein PilF
MEGSLMTSNPPVPPDDWLLTMAAAASEGLAVISLDELPRDGGIPNTPESRVQLADAHVRTAIGALHHEDLDQAEEHCRAALALARHYDAALACELAVLRARGMRTFADDRADVERSARDPFIVSVSYLMSAPPPTELTPEDGSRRGLLISNHTLAAGYFIWQAIRVHPAASAPLTNLAAVLHDIGARAGAEDVLHRALEVNPDDAHALHHLGFALLGMDRLADALPLLRRAATLGLPQARDRIDDLAEQVDAAERALAHAADPGTRVELLYRLGRHQELVEAVTGNPSSGRDATSAYLHAYALLHLGRPADAAAAFLACSDFDPLLSHLWAAVAYKAAGRLAEAAELARAIAVKDPILLDAQYLLAEIHRQRGKTESEQRCVAALFMLHLLE